MVCPPPRVFPPSSKPRIQQYKNPDREVCDSNSFCGHFVILSQEPVPLSFDTAWYIQNSLTNATTPSAESPGLDRLARTAEYGARRRRRQPERAQHHQPRLPRFQRRRAALCRVSAGPEPPGRPGLAAGGGPRWPRVQESHHRLPVQGHHATRHI